MEYGYDMSHMVQKSNSNRMVMSLIYPHKVAGSRYCIQNFKVSFQSSMVRQVPYSIKLKLEDVHKGEKKGGKKTAVNFMPNYKHMFAHTTNIQDHRTKP
jgi:hypothetical protein